MCGGRRRAWGLKGGGVEGRNELKLWGGGRRGAEGGREEEERRKGRDLAAGETISIKGHNLNQTI